MSAEDELNAAIVAFLTGRVMAIEFETEDLAAYLLASGFGPLAAAVEGEREACARVADEAGELDDSDVHPFWNAGHRYAGQSIASAIRARATPARKGNEDG